MSHICQPNLVGQFRPMVLRLYRGLPPEALRQDLRFTQSKQAMCQVLWAQLGPVCNTPADMQEGPT